MTRINRFVLAALATCLSAQPAFAFACKAQPSVYLAVNSAGVVYTWLEGRGIMGLCNLNTATANVGADSCRAWYSSLLTWRSTGKDAWFYFTPEYASNAGATSCTSFNQWEWHEAYHMEGAP